MTPSDDQLRDLFQSQRREDRSATPPFPRDLLRQRRPAPIVWPRWVAVAACLAGVMAVAIRLGDSPPTAGPVVAAPRLSDQLPELLSSPGQPLFAELSVATGPAMPAGSLAFEFPSDALLPRNTFLELP